MITLKTTFLTSMLLGFFYISSAAAYTFTITNATNEKIRVDPCGWGISGCSMMQGKNVSELSGYRTWKTRREGSTMYFINPGANPYLASTKPTIDPGKTVVLEFTAEDAGVCFDWQNFKVGIEKGGFSMQVRTVKKV